MMTRAQLLAEMKASVGTKDPLEFFSNLVDVFNMMFDRMESLEKDLKRVKTQSALAIQWEPKVASDMIARQVNIMRQDIDRDAYVADISALKKAFAEDVVTQNYNDFCSFWVETLGWHPFLD